MTWITGRLMRPTCARLRLKAQSRGITLGQLMEEAGVVRRPDGGWEWSAPILVNTPG